MAGKNMICLWFNGLADEAARFYAATFPKARRALRTVPRAIIPPVKMGKIDIAAIEAARHCVLKRRPNSA